MFKLLGDIKSIVDASQDQDEECDRLADWCGLVTGILASLAHDYKEKIHDNPIRKSIESSVLEVEEALHEIWKLVRERKGKKGFIGTVTKLATAKTFKEKSERAQKKLRDLMQALQLAVSARVSAQVNMCILSFFFPSTALRGWLFFRHTHTHTWVHCESCIIYIYIFMPSDKCGCRWMKS